MSLLAVLLIIWSVITGAFILVVIYRSVISMREDDQLFLDRAEAAAEREQREVRAKLDRITPYFKYLGLSSAVLLLIIFGLWVYQGFR
jgi:hypothetical protein